MTNNTIKNGDWFQLDNILFKVYECLSGTTTVLMHQMFYDNGDYVEGKMYFFSIAFIHSHMKPYTPYQEEADEEETE